MRTVDRGFHRGWGTCVEGRWGVAGKWLRLAVLSVADYSDLVDVVDDVVGHVHLVSYLHHLNLSYLVMGPG